MSRPDDVILLGHGAGGRLSRALVADHFLPALDNPALGELLDGMADGRWGETAPGTRDRFRAAAHAFADGMALLQPTVRRAEAGDHLKVVREG